MSDGWLSALSAWLLELFQALLRALYQLFHDILLWPFQAILDVVASVINLLPVPSFMVSGSGFGQLLGGLPSFALFVVGQMNFSAAFLIIGSGVAFRLARKLATLGQW